MYNNLIWFELTAFLLSLVALPVLWKSSYLRVYPVLLLIVTGVEGFYYLFPEKTSGNARVYNIQIPLQYTCYLLILYYAADNKQLKHFIAGMLWLLAVFCILTTILFMKPGDLNVWSYSLCSVLTLIATIGKFYEMLKNPAGLDFLQNPFFYMLFAFLLFNLITLPYFSMGKWLYYTKGFRNVSMMLYYVSYLLNYLLYIVYTICFVWILRRKGIY